MCLSFSVQSIEDRSYSPSLHPYTSRVSHIITRSIATRLLCALDTQPNYSFPAADIV